MSTEANCTNYLKLNARTYLLVCRTYPLSDASCSRYVALFIIRLARFITKLTMASNELRIFYYLGEVRIDFFNGILNTTIILKTL